jgi:hypothetical protein
MAKRLHPTSKSIRQGQTIYLVFRDYSKGYEAPPKIDTIYIHSQKKELPPKCCVIQEMPVSRMREILINGEDKFSSRSAGNQCFYYSSKKALTAYKKLEENTNG